MPWSFGSPGWNGGVATRSLVLVYRKIIIEITDICILSEINTDAAIHTPQVDI